MSQPFHTTYMKEFPWPLPKPGCARPIAPPVATKPPGYYMYRPLEGTCPCDKHEVKPLEDRYRALAHKECNMLADLCGLRKEMTYLTNQIMDHRCGDAKSKWKSVSMADYVCAGSGGVDLAQGDYRSIMAATDSPVGVTIPPARLGVGYGFRDPASFRHPPHIRPTIDPARPLCFMRTPVTVATWLEPYPGKSEYEDTYSRMGITILRCQQQYREPKPTTRRRFGDPCV